MAIRQRKGRKKPWEVYWNNPFTLKRESLYVETEEEAKKQDALTAPVKAPLDVPNRMLSRSFSSSMNEISSGGRKRKRRRWSIPLNPRITCS